MKYSSFSDAEGYARINRSSEGSEKRASSLRSTVLLASTGYCTGITVACSKHPPNQIKSINSRAQTLYQGWIFMIRVHVTRVGMRFSAKDDSN
jgi:hypothetical protein